MAGLTQLLQVMAEQDLKLCLAACRCVVLLNGAGRFEDVQTAVTAPLQASLSQREGGALDALDSTAQAAQSGGVRPSVTSQPNASPSDAAGSQTSLIQAILSPIATLAKRVAVYGSFVLTKQPSRIKSVLNQVGIAGIDRRAGHA